MTGGVDYAASQFNRAVLAKRQPGSSFKVFVYSAAIDQGLRPTDKILDGPLEIHLGPNDTWKPRNYDDEWHGEVTLQTAFAQSINIPAVRLSQKVGLETVIGVAQRMGITTPLKPVPAIALGACEVTLFDMVGAYSTFPNLGNRVVPSGISEIDAQDGHPLYHATPRVHDALNPKTAGFMLGMLREVMNSGTGKPASFGGPHGGKTGTTSENRDAWFIGFTPEFVCGVWMGNDHNEQMHGVYGGTVCGPAWRRIVLAAVKARGSIGDFPQPWWMADEPAAGDDHQVAIGAESTKVRVKVCKETGLLAGPGCPWEYREFDPGDEPKTRCMLHGPEEMIVPEPSDNAPPPPPPPAAGAAGSSSRRTPKAPKPADKPGSAAPTPEPRPSPATPSPADKPKSADSTPKSAPAKAPSVTPP
jgi:membrane peptidoglycan carboxypeptidase